MLLFSGCSDNEAETQLETQQMLDDGDYQGVITKLANEPSTIDNNMALGAAYMGRSGIALSDIMKIMLDSGDGGDDAFATFAEGINDKKSPTALKDLKNSSKHYNLATGGVCDDEDANLTNSQQDVCMNAGLSDTVSAVVTISYLGDVGSLLGSSTTDENGTVVVNDELTASSCAMDYAFNGFSSNAECTAVEDGNVTFENNATYTTLIITMDSNNTYDYLLTAPASADGNVTYFRQTALTDGYCADIDNDSIVEFPTTRLDINVSERQTMTLPLTVDGNNVYICPVNQDAPEEELTAAELMVDVLNGGLDSITAATGGDAEMATQIEDFKAELQADNPDANGTITVEDIISYLNTQN